MEATEKQVQFIARLVEEREIPPAGSARSAAHVTGVDTTC